MSVKTLAVNIVSLYGIQIVGYAVPLVTLPFLARRLGPVPWGQVAFAESYAALLSVVIEYGFGLSACREIAKHRFDETRRAECFANTLAAQLILLLLGVGGTLLIGIPFPHILPVGGFFWLATLLSVGRSFTPSWYFQGIENLKVVAILNVSATAAAGGLLFVLIHSPADAWKVLALRAASSCGVAFITLVLAIRLTRLVRPNFASALATLRQGFSLFIFKSVATLYTTANVLLLGVLATPVLVGWYAGADRISRVAISTTGPISQAFYPRIARLAHTDRAAASRSLMWSGLLMISVAGMVSVALLFGAPLLVHLLLGKNFEPSVVVLRCLSPLPILIATSDLLGVQWMLPLRMDRVFNTIVVAAGLINIILAVILVPRLHAPGMAASVVTAEFFVSSAMLVVLRIKNLLPWLKPGGNAWRSAELSVVSE